MFLRVGVLVEGHGEDGAIRTLLERIWYELLCSDQAIDVYVWRRDQGTLLKEEGLKKRVEALKIKLDYRRPSVAKQLMLILLDSEGECPATLGPSLLKWANEARSDADIACVLAHPMFETWFAACAESLAGENDLPVDLQSPDDPEGNRRGKGWIKKQLPRKYKETTDQPSFVAKMDLQQCRDNSPSFDKLCRELEKLLPQPEPEEPPSPADEEGTES